MNTNHKRLFFPLSADIVCEHKSINDPVDSTMIFHNHDGYEILFLIDGEVDLYTEGVGKRLIPGDLACIRANDFHAVNLYSKYVYNRIVINIIRPLLHSLSSEHSNLSACFQTDAYQKLNVYHLSNTDITHFIRLASGLREALKNKSFGDDILADTYLKQILILINRCTLEDTVNIKSRDVMPELVAKLFNYIDEHITEEITVQMLADYTHHNGVYLSRCFKNVTGTSIQQYIIAKRIMLAQRLLRKGHSPGDVCFSAGFHNYSNFSRTFSKYSGMSPKQYQLSLHK